MGRKGGERREERWNNQSVITQRSTARSDGMCHVVTKSNHNQSRWRGSGVTGAGGVAVWEEGDTCWLMAAVNQPSSTWQWFGSLRERARRGASPLPVYAGVAGLQTWLIDLWRTVVQCADAQSTGHQLLQWIIYQLRLHNTTVSKRLTNSTKNIKTDDTLKRIPLWGIGTNIKVKYSIHTCKIHADKAPHIHNSVCRWLFC